MSDDCRQSLQNEAREYPEQYIANDYKDKMAATNISVLGEGFLYMKEGSNIYVDFNRYYVVFSATVSGSNGQFDAVNVYYPVFYDRVLKVSDDDYITVPNPAIAGFSTVADDWNYSYGYTDGKRMYDAIFTKASDKYNIEVTEGLKQFAD